MMMSIFSSFDVLSGEFFGQKINKLPSGLCRQADGGDWTKLDGGKSPSSSPPAAAAEKNRQEGEGSHQVSGKRLAAGTRFAVELDGVHCFETIVCY